MKAEIKGGNLIITLPIKEQPSKSGKSITVATTNGNQPSGLEHKGKPLVIGVNAYVKAD